MLARDATVYAGFGVVLLLSSYLVPHACFNRCDFEECNQKFATSKDLKLHEKVHKGNMRAPQQNLLQTRREME